MNICFYNNHPYWGGLQNNGGSRTILLSAQTLRELGHNVNIVATCDKFTWFPHPPIKKDVSKNVDVVIAVGVTDIPIICKKFPDKKLAYWARPFEFWQMPKNKIIKTLKMFHMKHKGIILCNSEWQVNWLKKHSIKSILCYSGQNLDYKEYKPDHQSGYAITMGTQYSKKPRKGWKEFKAIADILGNSVECLAFGSEKCKKKIFSKYLRNPSRKELNDLYRTVDVFVCCSSLEGFYNPGVEASMQGCVLVMNNKSKNGTMDYAQYSQIYDTPLEASEYIMNPDFKSVKKTQTLIKEKIGDRKRNMEWMIKCLK